MLRDLPELLIGLITTAFIIIILMFYYSTSIQQDRTVQLMNEVIRTSAISNIDHSSRVKEGQVYISKPEFENEVVGQLLNNDGNLFSDEMEHNFEYLENEEGAIKSIRLNLKNDGKEYQSTIVVDIADE